MDRRAGLAVALGGAGGASLRWALVESALADTGSWPWAILVANVTGAALLGAVMALFGPQRQARPVFAGATVGFCGSLTTFSAFAVDTAVFLRDDRTSDAIGYVGVSLVVGIAAFVAAGAMVRKAVS